LALKANRPAMRAEVEAFFADSPPDSVRHCEIIDADHGRIETRRHAVSHDVDWLFADRRYPGDIVIPGLACIAMVEVTIERDGPTTTGRRCYVSSATLTPERFATAVRAHWGSENAVHCILDTAFDEDRARHRKDHSAENLALNVLRCARPDISIRRKRKRSGSSAPFATTILSQLRGLCRAMVGGLPAAGVPASVRRLFARAQRQIGSGARSGFHTDGKASS
jgi:Transposase